MVIDGHALDRPCYMIPLKESCEKFYRSVQNKQLYC